MWRAWNIEIVEWNAKCHLFKVVESGWLKSILIFFYIFREFIKSVDETQTNFQGWNLGNVSVCDNSTTDTPRNTCWYTNARQPTTVGNRIFNRIFNTVFQPYFQFFVFSIVFSYFFKSSISFIDGRSSFKTSELLMTYICCYNNRGP